LANFQDVRECIILGHEESDIVKSTNAWIGVDLATKYETSDKKAVVGIVITHYALRSNQR